MAAHSACHGSVAHFTRIGNSDTPENTASLPRVSDSHRCRACRVAPRRGGSPDPVAILDGAELEDARQLAARRGQRPVAAARGHEQPIVGHRLAALQRNELAPGIDGGGAFVLGARFVGRSKHEALGEWATTSEVIECEPERVFAWAVENAANPTAIWRFRLEPRDGGTELSQWMQMGPARSGLSFAIDRMPDKEQKIVFVRMREFEQNMAATLAHIKKLAEG